MRIAFSVDPNGAILVAYDPDAPKIDKYTTEYIPQPGEKLHIMNLPKELEGKALDEIARSYLVNVSGANPVFKPLR